MEFKKEIDNAIRSMHKEQQQAGVIEIFPKRKQNPVAVFKEVQRDLLNLICYL